MKLPKYCTLLMAVIGITTETSAATLISLTADAANSSSSGFSGSVAGTLSDGFSYDPLSPTAALPDQAYSSNGDGFHASLGEGVQAILSYTLTSGIHTTTVTDPTIVVDLFGRDSFGDRDDDVDVILFNGDYVTQVATVTGVSISDTSPYYARATFSGLAVGTSFDRIRIIGNALGHYKCKYLTVLSKMTHKLDSF